MSGKKKQSFFGGIIKCTLWVIMILVAVSVLSDVLNGDLRKENGNFIIEAVADFFESYRDSAEQRLSEEERAAIPESLQKLYDKNEDAREFVLNYEEYHDRDFTIDISGDVRSGRIPHFLQWDKRWGYRQYGDDFMAVTGCGPTALSMVYTGLTGKTDLDPYSMAQLAEAKGYYVSGTGSSWSMMTELAESIGLSPKELSLDEDLIRNKLENGHPIICIMGPGDFTDAGHFIVLTKLDKKGKVIVRDPNSTSNSDKHWELDKIIGQIRNLWCY